MTEYTSSSQALREYMTSRERTAYWIQTNEEIELCSPSAPPSVLSDGWVPSSPVSEVESSHSIPPRMLLRYGNGIPDVPIPHSADSNRSRSRQRESGSRSRSPVSPTSSSSRRRARSGSHPSSPLAQSGPYGSTPHTDRSPPAPEEIKILPSQAPLPSSSSFNQPRSKSLPRSAEYPIRHDPMPGLSTNPRIRTPYPGATSPTSRGPPLPPVAVAQPSPFPPQPWHQYPEARAPPHLQKQPPSIIYAPSKTTSRPHYTPPAIFHHPPQMGPNGVTYSHSAPVGSAPQYSQSSGLPSTMVPPSHTLARYREEQQRGGTWNGHNNTWGHDRNRSLNMVPPPLSPSSSSDSLDTDDSGSTYYVLPSAGQKILVLPPSPDVSDTATSMTRSPVSPQSLNKKPPFFKRLFSFGGRFSSVSGEDGRRLERRHSTSGAERRPNFVHR